MGRYDLAIALALAVLSFVALVCALVFFIRRRYMGAMKSGLCMSGLAAVSMGFLNYALSYSGKLGNTLLGGAVFNQWGFITTKGMAPITYSLFILGGLVIVGIARWRKLKVK